MKKLILSLAVVAAAFTSCDEKDPTTTPPTPPIVTPETHVTVELDATSKTLWHYYSFAEAKVIGTGAAVDDALWAERKDWDMAVCRYKVKTNSGASGKGLSGLYSHVDEAGKNIVYDFKTFTQTPATAVFIKDIEVTEESMSGGTTTESKSTAVVSIMAPGMPPVWLKSPLYIIPSADGEHHYKVDFLSYKNAENISGQISFQFAKIEK